MDIFGKKLTKKELKRKVQELESSNNSLIQKNYEWASAYDKLQSDLDQLRDAYNVLNEHFNNLRRKHFELHNNHSKRLRGYADLNEKYKELSARYKEAEDLFTKKFHCKEVLRSRVNHKRTKLELPQTPTAQFRNLRQNHSAPVGSSNPSSNVNIEVESLDQAEPIDTNRYYYSVVGKTEICFADDV